MLLFSLAIFAGCGSKTTGATARPEKVDALLAQKLLTEGNTRFVEGKIAKKDVVEARQMLDFKGQKPFAVVLACSEADVPPELLFDQNLGDLVVVRTVGNVLDPISLGSIEYGVEHYKAPLLVVLGHTDCGIIEEVIEAKETCPGNIPTIQEKLRKSVNQAKEGGLKGDALISQASALNVTDVLEQLKTSHIIQEFKAGRGLKVIGAKYDSKTGKVEWYEDGGCDLGEGFSIPEAGTEAPKSSDNSGTKSTIPDNRANNNSSSEKWQKPSEKIE